MVGIVLMRGSQKWYCAFEIIVVASLGERGKILLKKVTHKTFGGREKVWRESKNNLAGTKQMAGK
jgi:hypothetical protein